MVVLMTDDEVPGLGLGDLAPGAGESKAIPNDRSVGHALRARHVNHAWVRSAYAPLR